MAIFFRLRYANGSLYVELLELRAGKPCESYRIVPIPYLTSDQTRAVLEKNLQRDMCHSYLESIRLILELLNFFYFMKVGYMEIYL
ncbi:hypothetical protein GCM10020331_064390 [Ectobacillus funiculus]